MKKFTLIITLILSLAAASGCANRRGFTMDGGDTWIGGEVDKEETLK